MDLKSDNSSLLISYLALRKAVGIIGIAPPVVLVLGNWRLFHANAIEDSISYYYHTSMRGVLVGSLWAIGIFLMSYRGYQKRDEIAGRFACIFALFPTAQTPGTCDIVHLFRLDHGGCVLLTLAYFSLFLFTETHPGRKQDMTKRKRERNIVYYVSGWIIVASIIGILVLHIGMHINCWGPIPVLFAFESVAVVTFGVSWFVKGEFVLKDQ